MNRYQLGLSDVSEGDFYLLKHKITILRSCSVCAWRGHGREMKQWETVPIEACLSSERRSGWWRAVCSSLQTVRMRYHPDGLLLWDLLLLLLWCFLPACVYDQRGAVPLLCKENSHLLVFLLCEEVQLYEAWGAM